MTARRRGNRRSVGRPVGVAIVLGCLLATLVAGGSSGAAAAGDGALSQSGTGRFSDLRVTVSQVDHLRNQVVRVSWTGGHRSSTSGRNFFNNYLQIMQCWGDEVAPQREKCQYGGIFDDQRGGEATSSREIVNNGELDDPDETYSAPFPATAVVPFASVTGKTVTGKRNEFFDSQSTNEIDYGRTSADGSGEEFFEVQTGREAPGLGCGAVKPDGDARDCWLVVVPRDDTEVNGVDVNTLPGARLETSPLSASNFAHALSFRLHFDPVGVTCPIGSAERRILGNESAAEAVGQWQPALCEKTGAIFGYSQIADEAARKQALTDDPWLSLVNRPLAADQNPDSRLLSYAPVAVSAVGVGLVIERTPRDSATDGEKARRGTRVVDLKLNARLVAKLLTQTYTAAVTGDTEHVTGNPRWLAEDPEFLALNPEFKDLQYIGQLYSITNPLGLSDANRSIWEWIRSDPDARAFIDGRKDPWGTRVNPFYRRMDLGRSDFPRSDPTCVNFSNGQAALCALDHLAYAADFHAAARGAIRGQTLANDTWDLAATPPRYKQNPAQAPGERAVLLLTDTATAARFKISMARLRNASGSYVAPDPAGMSAALGAATRSGTDGVLAPDPGTKARAAYPLTEITYAMTAPRQLDKAEAADYAGLIRYVADEGQQPGLAPGDLPDGYLPLPEALRKQAATVADLVAKQGGPAPVTSEPSAPAVPVPETGTDVPLAGAPVAVAAPGAQVPAAGPVSGLVGVSATTTRIAPGGSRYLLLAALVIGLLALCARPTAIGLGAVRQYRQPGASGVDPKLPMSSLIGLVARIRVRPGPNKE